MRSHAILEVWVLLSIGALYTAGALFFLDSVSCADEDMDVTDITDATNTMDTTDGGLVAFIGFYQEDPLNNPEDALPGEMYTILPAGDGVFDGEFLFS